MTQAVNEATVNSSAGELEKIRMEATAQQVKAQEKAAQTKTIEIEANSLEIRQSSSSPSGNSGSGGKSSVEAGLYGDLAMDAMGLKTLSTAIEFFDTRRMDAAGGYKHVEGIMGSNVRTMDQMMGDALRAPGHYESASKFLKGGGEDILMRSNIAASSLKDQGKEALSTWACPEKATKLAHVAQAKQLTFTSELASEKALNSVYAVQPQQSAIMYKANQMVPGLGMGSGPSIRPAELLSQAEKINEDRGTWGTA